MVDVLKKKLKKTPGFTLIEMLVFIFIFVVVTFSFYRTIAAGMIAIVDAKSKLGAVALANERMEVIRNLSYDNIGTIEGVPPGSIPQDEIISRSGRDYYVHTNVGLVDDPQDGTAHDAPGHIHADGDDVRSGDYKKVRVQVYWINHNEAKSVYLVSTFTPPGVEAVYAGGILSINAIDSEGHGIPQATVHIYNNDVSPTVNVTQQADNNGNIYFPQSPVSSEKYYIEISKTGYYPVKTYARASNFEPMDLNASVVEGAINQKSITTDRVSSINLYTRDPLGNSVPNVSFDLEGGKRIGSTTPSLPKVSERFYPSRPLPHSPCCSAEHQIHC